MQTTSSQCQEYYRIFVGGLSFDVDNHKLKESFSPFGNLKKALVIRDQKTGKSKGYGFATFSSRDSFLEAMRTQIFINGRLADCHEVLTKGALKEQEQRDVSNKLFVGGVSQNTTAEDLEWYFSKFGAIKEARILYDGKSGKSRGFGFVLFSTAASLEYVFNVQEHRIRGKIVEIKRFSKEKDFKDLEAEVPVEVEQPVKPKKNKKKKSTQTQEAKKKKRLESISTQSEKDKQSLSEEFDFSSFAHNAKKLVPVADQDVETEQMDQPGATNDQKPIGGYRGQFSMGNFYSNATPHGFDFGFSQPINFGGLSIMTQKSVNSGYPTVSQKTDACVQDSWHPSQQLSYFTGSSSSIPAYRRCF